jgi:hypothetical protein
MHFHKMPQILFQAKQKLRNKHGLTNAIIIQPDVIYQLIELVLIVLYWPNLAQIEKFHGLDYMCIDLKLTWHNNHKVSQSVMPTWVLVILKPVRSPIHWNPEYKWK